jgi:hypothetical protein
MQDMRGRAHLGVVRVVVLLLKVRVRDVLAGVNGLDMLEVLADLGVVALEDAHRVVVELVRQDDRAAGSKAAGGCVGEDGVCLASAGPIQALARRTVVGLNCCLADGRDLVVKDCAIIDIVLLRGQRYAHHCCPR